MRRQYLHYRNSGVEWLGEVPKHWEVRRIKRVVSMNPSKLEVRGTLTEQTPVVFLPMEKVEADGQIDESEIRSACEVWDGFTYFRKEDILVAKITPCFENGKGAFLGSLQTDVGFGSTEFHVLRADRSILPKFLYHLTTTQDFRAQGTDAMTGAAGQKRVPSLFVEHFPIPIPPLNEQRAIAEFLDRETKLVDKLVAKKRLLIERLAEYRTALITRTVTQGLPPEGARAAGFDPSPRLKPSNIEWLGDVPAHWEVRRVRNVVDLRVSNVDKKIKDGELSVRLCNYVDVYKNERVTADLPFMQVTATTSEIARFRLGLGDVLITKDSETWDDIGVPSLVEYAASDLVCGYHLALLRSLESLLDGEYLFRILQSSAVCSQFHVSASGVTRYGLTQEAIKSVLLPIPPLEEQRAIVAFLDRGTERIDSLSRRVETAIEQLQEYRTSLITAAVTGKIDVREPEYEKANQE